MELLVVTDCPNEALATRRLRQALDETGHPDVPITVRLITDTTLAAAPAFAGSPTILIDGTDPFADPPGSRAAEAGDVGLSCRVYSSPQGFSGAPSVEALRRVLAPRHPSP